MAPEVMCRQNHTTSVDFFAVGVMAFECMFGRVSRYFVSSLRRQRRLYVQNWIGLKLWLTFLIFAETIHWQVEKGNQRPHIVQADSDQGQRHLSRLVCWSCWLHQQGKFLISSERKGHRLWWERYFRRSQSTLNISYIHLVFSRWSNESLKIDLVQTEQRRSSLIPGSEIFLGRT